jgi:hypothetical protein
MAGSQAAGVAVLAALAFSVRLMSTFWVVPSAVTATVLPPLAEP